MQSSVAISVCKAAAAHDGVTLAAMARLREAMQTELDAAYDRIEQLEGIVGLRVEMPSAFKLPPYPKKIFGILMQSAGWVSIETIETALYGHLPDCDWPTNPRGSIKTHVRHMRDRLDKFGIEVDTIFAAVNSGGYFLPPQMKIKVRDLLRGSVNSATDTAAPQPCHASNIHQSPVEAIGGVQHQ